MTNLYFFFFFSRYSILQNFFCAGIQIFIVLNSYDKFNVSEMAAEVRLRKLGLI